MIPARDFQIAFERKLRTIDPTEEILQKLTSEDIFEWGYRGLLEFTKQSYLLDDQTENGTRVQRKNSDAIKCFIKRVEITPSVTNGDPTNLYSTSFAIPSDYYLYVRSFSKLSKTYDESDRTETPIAHTLTPNKVIKDDDVNMVMNAFYNRPIILNPYVVVNNDDGENDVDNPGSINVISDEFTDIQSLVLVYYRKPKRFNVLNVDSVNILSYCELPSNLREELVDISVDLYLFDGKYKLNIQSNNNAQDTND